MRLSDASKATSDGTQECQMCGRTITRSRYYRATDYGDFCNAACHQAYIDEALEDVKARAVSTTVLESQYSGPTTWTRVDLREFPLASLGSVLKLTPRQERTIAWLYRKVLEHDGLGEVGRGRYVYKEVEVKQCRDTGTLLWYSTVGAIGDEGTMAEVFCRKNRHILIGKQGKVELLNAKDGQRVTGDAVLYELTS